MPVRPTATVRNPRTVLLLVMAALSCCVGTLRAEKKLIDRLPARSQQIENFNATALMAEMKEAPLHHIEGVWQFPATGVSVAIRLQQPSRAAFHGTPALYDIIIIHSPNRAIRPGTIMGIAAPAAKRGEYDARIYTKNIGSQLIASKKFILTLSDSDNTLAIRPYRSKIRFNIFRMLPYLWRPPLQLTRGEDRTDGCIRIFPTPSEPREPVYL